MIKSWKEFCKCYRTKKILLSLQEYGIEYLFCYFHLYMVSICHENYSMTKRSIIHYSTCSASCVNAPPVSEAEHPTNTPVFVPRIVDGLMPQILIFRLRLRLKHIYLPASIIAS